MMFMKIQQENQDYEKKQIKQQLLNNKSIYNTCSFIINRSS